MQFNKYFIVFVLLGLMGCDASPSIREQSEEVFTEGDSIAEHLLDLKQNEGLVYHGDKPFTGFSIQYHANGQLAESSHYQDGKRHGRYKKWFENGLLSFESEYRTGRRHGLTKSWWNNGQLRSESNYEAGVAHGDQRQWYKSGAKFKHIQLVNGAEEGMQRSWRENGKIYNNYEAKNGRIFGLKRANLCFELDDEKIKLQD